MEDGDRWKDGIERQLDAHAKKIESLEAWRNWVVGIVGGVGLMAGAFAKNLAELWRHMT